MNLFTYLPIHLLTSNKIASLADGGNKTRNDGKTLVPSKCIAFTLAEVLITLGIIGVVAAMTMPTLIANHKAKVLETEFKKGVSVISQALNMYQAHNGEPLKPGDMEDWEELRDKFVLKYFKVIKDCGRGYINGSCLVNNGWGIEGNSTTYTTLTGDTLNLHPFDDGQYILQDGSILLFEYSGSTMDENGKIEKFYISIDINGIAKKPNRLGQDLFTFQVDKNGKLLPMGASGTTYTNHTRYCSTTSNDNLNGISCAEKALSDPDYFKKLSK